MRAPAWGQSTLPVVAIHDSELTRNLETVPASGLTPTGPGTTGKQWWPVDWHYFVMPESVQEALRSDGTAFTVVRDADIAAGLLLPDGSPKYPILISLASEAIADNEIGPLTNYVAAGGYLLVGSSAFTRNPDGTSRGNFAFAQELGLQMISPGLANWSANNTFTKRLEHRLASDIPSGQLTWRMPSTAEETSWGISSENFSLNHHFLAPHDLWQVQTVDATVLAMGDAFPYVAVKSYGKGYFIYHAAFQPLIGHGGFAPGMYAYALFRRSIEWAFEAASRPVPKLSPWPYPYDAALIVRHDLENYSHAIANIEASAQVEYTNGVKGDYYFCTGTLREEMDALGYDTNAVIASLGRAVANYGATIGPHNGGLKNPNNPALVLGDYDYWHWGPDEALDVTPRGYLSGKAYAQNSMANSFADVESWLPGQTGGLRLWAGCYFNATREDSYDIEAQLGVNIAGEQKLTPFPHWTLSTQTSGKRYPFLSEPVSDWFVGGLVAQSLEPWHPPGVHTSATLHQAIDYYYRLGALLNFYDHTLATGEGDAGPLALDYITYSMNGSLHPRLWPANAIGVYQWWRQRANAQITASYASGSGDQAITTLSIAGATDPNTAVEFVLPGTALSGLVVTTNGVVADATSYRLTGQTLKVWVGTAVSSVGVSYVLGPQAQEDFYLVTGGTVLSVPGPGVLSNDQAGASKGSLAAVLVSNPAHGTLALNPDGSFSYSPSSGYVGLDSFTYAVNDGVLTSSPATVSLMVGPSGSLFYDDFTRLTDPAPLAPWIAQSGLWEITGGVLKGGPDPLQTYGYVYGENWADYAVEGRIQFPPGAFGGGIGGRLDAVTGAHYAAWVYPEGAGTPALLKLVKFQTWENWGYSGSVVPMQQVSLPNVGTDWHTLKLTFVGTQIAVYFDGFQVISMADQEPQPYLSGGISIGMWTGVTPYTMLLDNIVVYPLIPLSLVASAPNGLQVDLAWVDSGSASTSFTLQRALDSTFTSGLQSWVLDAAATNFSDTTVAANTTYYYRINASNSVGITAWVYSTPASITTLFAGPLVAISPTGRYQGTRPVYTFTTIPGATTGYQIMVSNNIAGGKVTTQTITAAQAGSGTYTQPTALALGSYTWWVRAQNAGGYSPWSLGLSFTVEPPPAPTQISPSGAVGTNMPTFTFTTTPGATQYRTILYNYVAGGYTYGNWINASQVDPGNTGTGTIMQPTPLPNSSYAWYVQAQNSVGMSPWSVGVMIYVGVTPPPAPTQISPSGAVGANMPTFTFTTTPTATQFTTTPTATQYRIILYDYAAGRYTSGNWINASQVDPGNTGTGTITQPTPLPNSSYVWYVQAQNSVGMSPWSMGVMIYIGVTPPPAPTQISPIFTVDTNMPTYKFSIVPGAAQYRIILYNYVTGTYTNGNWINASQVDPGNTGTGTITQPTPLANSSYVWYVQAQNSVGMSPWSVGVMIYVGVTPPLPPTQISPSGAAGTATPTCKFSMVTGATAYRIILYNYATASYSYSAWMSASQVDPGHTGTGSITQSAALATGKYLWYVQDQNPYGWSTWGSYLIFSVP